jgi:hypothetical protein
MAFFVRFSTRPTRGVQKHHKPQTFFWGSPCQKLFAQKFEGKNFSPVVYSPSICFIAFLAVSLHEELKNAIQIFSKIRPKNLKKSQKKVGM